MAEAGVDGVADPPLERPDRCFAGVALGDLAVVVGAAGTVAMADLGDGGYVDGVIESRLPHRDSRSTLRRAPEETSIGAVPL